MRIREGRLDLTATDVSNFLGCRHRVGLEMAAAAGSLAKPVFEDPQLEAMFRRGLEHESNYVASLTAPGRTVVDLNQERDPERAVSLTLRAMQAGAASPSATCSARVRSGLSLSWRSSVRPIQAE